MKHYILIFVLAFSSCSTNIQKETTTEEVVEKAPAIVNNSNLENDYYTRLRSDRIPVKIKYDSTIVVKRVYVTNPNGAVVKVKPVSFYKSIYNFPYGKHLSIIKDTSEWYGIKNRSIFSSWVMVFVLKSSTGDAKDLKIKPSDLLDVSLFSDFSSLSNNHSMDDLDMISKYIDLELISKSDFEKERKHVVENIFRDSLKVKNKNGDIEFILQDTVVRFMSNRSDGESREIPSYVGSISALNSYLIYIVGFEWEAFILIDNNNGVEKMGFESTPYLSPDGKHIICCRQEMYDDIGIIETYNVDSSTIKHQMSASFTKWVPTGENMFWSSDGCFYIEVYSSFINPSDYDEELKQYIRLRLK